MKSNLLLASTLLLTFPAFANPVAKIVINDLKAISALYSEDLEMYRGEAVKGDFMKSFCKGFVMDLAPQYSSDAQEGKEYELHIEKSVIYSNVLKDVKYTLEDGDGFIKVGFFCLAVEDKDMSDLELLQINMGSTITIK